RRNVRHCAAMTSPRSVSPARTSRVIRHSPFGPHQMTAGATQRRRNRPGPRREPDQFTDRRHSATVSAFSAYDIKKSDGLAEKESRVRGPDSAKQTEQSYVSRAGETSKC